MTEQESSLLATIAAKSAANEQRLDTVEADIKTIEADIKQINNDQKAIYKIATSVELIAQRVGHIEEKVNDTNEKVDAQGRAWQEAEKRLQNKVDEATNAPHKRTFDNVNSIKVAIITAICTALAGGLLMAIVNAIQ